MQIKVTKTSNSNINNVDIASLKANDFGRYNTDHLLEADFINEEWTNVKIKPFHKLSFSPFMSVLHYGQAIFEGMKAYKLINNKVAVFRLLDHKTRFNISANRLAMPSVPEEIFCDGMKQLLKIDSDWIYNKDNFSVYIRPFMFAVDENLGARASKNYKFMILLSPASFYFSKPLRIKVETTYTRAVVGGTGFIKAAGNYASSFSPTIEAIKEGFDQLLWMDGNEHNYVQEIGVTNVMFRVGETFYTPDLGDKTILNGVTRRSVIQYLKYNNYKVVEKKIHINEILEWNKSGVLMEAFGMGTATTLSIIEELVYNNVSIIPTDKNSTMVKKIKEYIAAVSYGRIKDEFNWLTFID